MTPLGHFAVSYSAGRVQRRALPYVIVGGLAPDLDFLLVGLSSFNALHRLLTHNLFFVGLVAAACALFAALTKGPKRAAFFGALLGGFGHLLLDAMLDSNPSNGVGVAALWPLSERFFSPFNLAPQTCPGWETPVTAIFCNLPLIFWELPFYLLAALLWWRVTRKAR